jgi:hypothetical protein
VQPGDADPIADAHRLDVGPDGGDRADDLMSRGHRHAPLGQLAFDDVQVGPADPAQAHTDEHLAASGRGHGDVLEHERRALDRGDAVQSCSAHCLRACHVGHRSSFGSPGCRSAGSWSWNVRP